MQNIPVNFSMTTSGSGDDFGSLDLGYQLLNIKQPSMLNNTHIEPSQESQFQFDLNSGSQLFDVPEPSSLPGSDNLSNDAIYEILSNSPTPSSEHLSDGQLGFEFSDDRLVILCLQWLIVYHISDTNLHSVSCLFLHMVMSSTLVLLIPLIMVYLAYEKVLKT